MDRLELVRRRLQHQCLAGQPLSSAGAVVDWLGAVQAQEYAEAKWSLGMRMTGAADGDVEAAFDRGEILRTHVLRPTWHFVTPADIRWLLRLTGPRVAAQNAGPYRATGLDAAGLGRGLAILARALADGRPRTRPELAERLDAEGVPAAGVRLSYVMMHAELEQVVVSGPRRGRQHTYQLLDDRAPPAPELTRDQALAKLARRYFDSHGPAGAHDFAWWSGLTVGDARAGIGLAGLEPDDDRLFGPPASSPPAAAGWLLLPTFDEAIIAYKEPRPILVGDPPRAGRLGRAIMADGRVVGSWQRRSSAGAVNVDATLFEPPSVAARQRLTDAVARFGAFLGVPAQLAVAVRAGGR